MIHYTFTLSFFVAAPTTSQEEVDDIHRILNGGVIQYYHRNDTLFRPSRVEAESLRAAQVCH